MREVKRSVLNKIMTLAISMAFIFTSLYVSQIEAQAKTKSEVVSQLNSLISRYNNTGGNSSVYYMGTQCKGFANWVFLQLFGVYIGPYPNNANYQISNAKAQLVGMLSPGGLNASTSKQLLQKAMPGDYIQAQTVTSRGRGPHSMIVVSTDENGIKVFDCNFVATNRIGTHYFSWSDFDQRYRACSLYHAWGYTDDGSSQQTDPDAGFSTANAGNYYVNTNGADLYLRSQPNTNSTILANIPNKTQLYVQKSNGSWAKVAYNGKTGYCSMQYLAKVQQLPGTEISYWFSKTKMGDAISSVKNGERVYFCYKLTRQDNGALVDCGEYNVKQTIYFPDGSSWDNTYSNSNNNWVSFVAGQGGNYRCTINLTGDWSGDYELTLYNVPSVKKVLSEDWFSSSPMGAKLNKLEKGKDYYYCFSIINEGNGYLNDTIYRNYTVTDNLYSPDGRRVNGWTENRSDRHYLKFTASQTGKYYGKYTVKFDGNSPVNVDGEKIDCVDTTPVLSKITVTKLPSKTSYYIGDKFDKTGMVVTASYSNGSSKAVTGYTVATNTSSVGTKNVRVSYTEGGISKTTSFDIYVQKKEEKKIKISFDLNGGQNESGSSELADAEIIKGSKFIVPYENPVKYVNIAFDSNGGDSTPDSMKIKEPLRRWEYYDSAYGLINTVTAGNRIVLNNDTTFKAIYGGHLDNLPQVTKKGYTFNGWYLNGKKYQNELIDSDIELVAHWAKNSNDDDTTVPDNKDSDDITGDLNKKNNDSDHSGNQTVDDGSNNSGNQTVDDGSDEFNVDTDDQDEDSDAVEIGDELEVGDAVYTILTIGDSATVEYTEYEGTAKKVVIPNEIAQDGKVYTVISVGDKAFYKNKDMTAVSIGKNVTKIGSKAFYGCSKLKQIVVYSKNITSISSKAFKKIQKSVKVLLPKSKYTSYKKLFKKAGISVKAKFKKIKL